MTPVRRPFLPLMALVAASLSAAPAHAWVDPSPVVRAERAFAADGLEMGVRDSFLKHSAPEGILFAPDPVLAKKAFEDPQPKGAPLVWWPLWAGISRSGDLGFTTGPYTIGGKPRAWYFTVWAKQDDGSWKWLYDGGPPSDPTNVPVQGSDVAYARLATRQAGSPAKAMAQVARIEAALAATAKTDLKAAYLTRIADDGRLVGSRAAPPTTRAGVEAELATRPAGVGFAPIGGRASAAGDFVWTYGAADWTEDGKARRGHYVRIWRYDAAGWRILFDELLPVPVPPS